MLEPRRLAARAAASYMASQLGEKVGETVGYQVRLDRKISRNTRIEVVTEGLLVQRLQRDPSLEDYGIVIFDEIHERSLDSELALALCRDSLTALRPDLRILLMSATLNANDLCRSLSAQLVSSVGKAFPVSSSFRPASGGLRQIPFATASAALQALDETTGDLLIFLPGVAEIERTKAALLREELPGSTEIHILHGGVPLAIQSKTLRPAAAGKRKIVLATSIAETSLTIEGVRCVIDCGWMRIPKYSPRTGMTRLETVRVTRDAADQRRGRAGRTAPGHCIRLWSKAEDTGLIANRQPEIADAELSSFALQLALWGVRDIQQLNWLTPPPEAALATARQLLYQLKAINPDGALTRHGESLAKMPMHPRLAHMIRIGSDTGCTDDACLIAALLSERDPLPRSNEQGCDIAIRLDLIKSNHHSLRPEITRKIRQLANDWSRGRSKGEQTLSYGELLALAYPERIARRRGTPEGDYVMVNGRGAIIPPDDPLCGAEWVVAAHLNDRGAKARILLGCEIEPYAIERITAQASPVRIIEWREKEKRVIAVTREMLGAIVVSEAPLNDATPEETGRALMQAMLQRGLSSLNWTTDTSQWIARVALLRREFPEDNWPDTSNKGLEDSSDKWLLPLLMNIRSLSQAQKADLKNGLLGLLTYEQSRRLEQLAPERIAVPSGSNVRINYIDGETPVLAVRIQELFGLQETPRIVNGRIALLMHLLSPAQRPIQITQDLAGFWKRGYAEARRELRGRYPKHSWPENPADGTASRYTRRRR